MVNWTSDSICKKPTSEDSKEVINVKLKSTATVILMVYLATIISVYATYKLTIQGKYTIVAEEITANPSQIDFGNVTRDSATNITVTLTNTGDYDFNSLHMSNNVLSSQGTLTWDIEGSPLSVGSSIDATFTLTLSENATVGEFPLEIYVEE